MLLPVKHTTLIIKVNKHGNLESYFQFLSKIVDYAPSGDSPGAPTGKKQIPRKAAISLLPSTRMSLAVSWFGNCLHLPHVWG